MKDREPDFNNLLTVLKRGVPERPTLFEFFMNQPVYELLAGETAPAPDDLGAQYRFLIKAFKVAGYDYATVRPSLFGFPSPGADSKASKSLDGAVSIRSREDFEKYPWPDPSDFSFDQLKPVDQDLPEGMKLIAYGPGGVLENVMELCGYQGLCYLMVDDPELVQEVFDAVGSRLEAYYRLASPYDSVGACIVNDDWGFKTQTMLRTEDMRKYVISWHRKIVKVIHDAGKPAILHSCGKLDEVMDDIIDDIGYEAKHSYEDTICPIEDAYEKYSDRIALLGGIDLDFLCRATQDKIRERTMGMIQRSADRGGWAVGSGNSIPEYVPQENYFTMINTVKDA